MNELLQSVAQRASRYLDGLATRPVAPTSVARARLVEFDRPLPEGPTNPTDVLAKLDDIGSPGTVASAGPRYFGFVAGGSLPAALAANWLAGAWDQNGFTSITSPVAAAVEATSLRWLLELLALPADAGGAFVTGATMANFTALAAARRAVLLRHGWDVDADGLWGAPPITVVVSAEVHPTVLKALGLLGLGRKRIVSVPTDAQGRMRAAALPSLTGASIVCLQAGNVNTGAFDPVGEICAQAHAADAWVHVDGAFGLWAAAAPARAALVAGVGDADSWATDAHKWLNVPYDSGVAFARDAEALKGAMAIAAPYLIRDATRQPADYTPEASRRARGIEVWAALHSLGRAGVADLIERTCRYAKRFAEALAGAGYAILNDVVLNQVLVSFGDDDTTRAVIAAIQADGTCWCGGTVWQGQTAMRISVSSWATTAADVDHSLEAIVRIARAHRPVG